MKELKSQLDSLNRQINLSLENKGQTEIEQQPQSQSQSVSIPNNDIRSNQPMSIKEIVDANRDRIFTTRPDTSVKETDAQKTTHPSKVKGIKM